jgi:hypothetical protein|tara:strand:- start:453 stop:1049 length:597 start_codon:yes stop_codon:yes gene_type:complete
MNIGKEMIRIFFSFIFTGVVLAQVAPDPEPEKPDISINFIKGDDELLLNWSVNTYVGYPVYQAQNFKRFDDRHFVYGLSLGTPIGMKTGLAYSTLDFELINFIFGNTNASYGEDSEIGETVLHYGLNSGMFINDLSLNITLAMGKYKYGAGYISAINIDLPYWGDYEVRGTIRFTAIPTDAGNTSGWIDLGVSLGYEF